MPPKTKRTELELLPDPAPRFPGKLMELAGKSYMMPALSLAQYVANKVRLTKLDAASDDFFETVIELTLVALKRNYPTSTKADVEEFLDLNNVNEIIAAITGRDLKAPAPAVPELGST